MTYAPTPIFIITNGTSLGLTCYFILFTWILTTTTCTSTKFVGKNKVQETMVGSAPLINFSIFVVVITCSFRELIVAIVTCIGEFFWEIVKGTSTSSLLSQSYI